MPTHLLDTDTLTLARAGDQLVTARLNAARAGAVAVTVITVEEQLGGWYTLLRRLSKPDQLERAYRGLADTVSALGRFEIVPFTVAAMGACDGLLRMKLNVKKNDLRIAATALVAGAVVVTRNRRDFGRVPGLVVEDWSSPPESAPRPNPRAPA